MQEMWVSSLVQKDPLEEEMATHCSMLAWEIPWTEEPGGLHSTEFPRVRHDWSDLARMNAGKWVDWSPGIRETCVQIPTADLAAT